MSERDLKADSELCNKATAGAWEHRWNPNSSEIYASGVEQPIILVGHNPHDADFIVQARDGWPHAIDRAIKAETLLRELIGVLEGVQRLKPLVVYDDVSPEFEEEAFALVGMYSIIYSAVAKAKEVLGDEGKTS